MTCTHTPGMYTVLSLLRLAERLHAERPDVYIGELLYFCVIRVVRVTPEYFVTVLLVLVLFCFVSCLLCLRRFLFGVRIHVLRFFLS